MLTVRALAFWLWTAMAAWVPPVQQTRAWREPEDVATARYFDLAESIARVVLDQDEPPVPGLAENDDEARARSALLLAAIASYESAYAATVVDCRVLGPGGAVGPFQTERRRGEACASVEGSVRVALDMVRESFRVCAASAPRDKLAFYTDGACRRDWGRSRWRVARASRWWTAHPVSAPPNDWGDFD